MKQFILCAVCLSFVLLLPSCASKPEKALSGKWQEVNGRETIEFLKDGTFHGNMIWDISKTSLAISGTYSVAGDLINLKPEIPQHLVPMTWKMEFANSANELTLIFQVGGALKLDGSSAAYRRMK